MREFHGQLGIESFPLAIIISRFNERITGRLRDGCLARLQSLGIREEHVTVVSVPGAVEIPIVAQQLAERGQDQAIIALGAVIRGETSHYDYVCEQVSQGCQKVSLDYHLPVIFGILTTENVDQALARVGGKRGHKGCEAAECAVEMVSLLQQLS